MAPCLLAVPLIKVQPLLLSLDVLRSVPRTAKQYTVVPDATLSDDDPEVAVDEVLR